MLGKWFRHEIIHVGGSKICGEGDKGGWRRMPLKPNDQDSNRTGTLILNDSETRAEKPVSLLIYVLLLMVSLLGSGRWVLYWIDTHLMSQSGNAPVPTTGFRATRAKTTEPSGRARGKSLIDNHNPLCTTSHESPECTTTSQPNCFYHFFINENPH